MEVAPTLLQNWLKHHAEYEASGRKLAFVMGPGGNAGIHSAGITCALWQTGSFLPNTLYIGSSVGAYSLLYTLIGQGFLAATIFGRFFTSKTYFNAARLFSKSPALNLEYVVEHVLETEIPLNYTNAQTSAYRLHALSTNGSGQPHLLPLTQTEKHLAQSALKATAAMPLVGRIHGLDNLEHWDGWLAEPNLLHHLKMQGITDVIWVLNRPLVEKLPLTVRLLWRNIIARAHRSNPAFADLIRQRLSAGDFLAKAPEGITLEIIPPLLPVASTTRSPAIIFNALGTSYRWMGNYLGQPYLPYPAEWKEWQHHMPR